MYMKKKTGQGYNTVLWKIYIKLNATHKTKARVVKERKINLVPAGPHGKRYVIENKCNRQVGVNTFCKYFLGPMWKGNIVCIFLPPFFPSQNIIIAKLSIGNVISCHYSSSS